MILNSEILAISGPTHLKQKPFFWKDENEINHHGIPHTMNFDWHKFKPEGIKL